MLLSSRILHKIVKIINKSYVITIECILCLSILKYLSSFRTIDINFTFHGHDLIFIYLFIFLLVHNNWVTDIFIVIQLFCGIVFSFGDIFVCLSIFRYIDSRTNEFLFFFVLQSFWNCHVFDSLSSFLILFWIFFNGERLSFRWRVVGWPRVFRFINGLVFFSKYGRHGLNIFFLFREPGDHAILADAIVVDDWAQPLFEYAVQVFFSLIHL